MDSRPRFRRLLVLTDNERLKDGVAAILCARERELALERVDYRFSPSNRAFAERFRGDPAFSALDLGAEARAVAEAYDLVISAHCKQIFPASLHGAITCVNLHPGFNPHNRGWYPQVFSLINGLPAGATLHLIDDQLDHGAIIDQERVEVHPDDTSASVYERVVEAELALFARAVTSLVANTFRATPPGQEGNLNLRRDFEALREIDLGRAGTFGEFLALLRALSHPPHRNAFYRDGQGRRIFVSLALEREQDQSVAVDRHQRPPKLM